MRKAYVICLTLAAFSGLGCGDEKSGPSAGPDTSWQYDCNPDTDCKGVSGDPHEQTEKNLIVASCRKNTQGMFITLEDPGVDEQVATTDNRVRRRSVLEIRNANPESNKCEVVLTEYRRNDPNAKETTLKDVCMGNRTEPGSCTFEGEAGDGYGFNGTLTCPNMRLNGLGEPEYRLKAAGSSGDEVQLQIVDC